MDSNLSELSKNNGDFNLFCWVLGQSDRPFSVTIGGDQTVDNLKKKIKKQKEHTFAGIDAYALDLWKLSTPLPSSELGVKLDHVRSPEEIAGSVQLDPFDALSEHFSSPPRKHLHIVVQLPDIHPPPYKRLRTLKSTPRHPPPNMVSRSETVAALYQKLNRYQFVQVRGTPGTGKTSLAKLLQYHITQEEPTTHVIWMQGWPHDDIKARNCWRNYFEIEKGWVENRQTVFVFDEAQLSYVDGDLWNNFFKSIHLYSNCRAITFTSYGSPTMPIMIQGTPIIIPDEQRVTLRAIQHGDGLPSAGLFFSRVEFDNLVSTMYPSPKYLFDKSFFDELFDLTDGHVGAITDFIRIILAHESYHAIRNISGQTYKWTIFMQEVSPTTLAEALVSGPIFRRGLPRSELQDPSFAAVFEAVLCACGAITSRDLTSDDEKEALLHCFRKGWLQADKLDEGEVGYSFPSSLHRWYVEWKLWGTTPSTPFNVTDILGFVMAVIRKFSHRLLSSERRIGPGFVQRPPEAQFQDEFYRCCHSYSKGSVLTFPEFGTKTGRVDFYIPTKNWGVELLRDGDRLEQHSARFSPTGKYGATLCLSDYIVLDCRVDNPKLPHPHLTNLHHVVFSDNFKNVCILDNMLNPVLDGEFILLP